MSALIVRNCYVLPIEDMETRLLYEDIPEFMDQKERAQAKASPLFRSTSSKVVTVSHHLAHAYSAFAACPFEDGVVMIVDGVGNYASDIREAGQLTQGVNPLARESESYYRFNGSELRAVAQGVARPGARLPERRVLFHAGPRCPLQPRVELHLRRLEQVRRGDGAGALWAAGSGEAAGRA